MKPYEPVEWVAPLKSGLTVIVKEDHSAPQVTITSVYGVGATADPKGQEGLAHFIEHLAFRSRPIGGPQYWDVLSRMGANRNASTSHDFTSYYTIAHKSNLPQMMQLEAWRLNNTIDGVTPDVFNTEREVVRNELRQRWETTLGNKMLDLILESLYPDGHPMRRPVGGTHESLTAITFDNAKAFVKEHYRPDNCTIVVAGDFDTEEVKKMLGMWPAQLLFGPEGPSGAAVPPRTRVGERPAPPVPGAPSQALKRHKGPTAESQLVLAWSLPPGLRGQDTLVEFAASRLNLALGEGLELDEDDDIEGAGASPITMANSSVMLMFATLKPGADPEKARKRLLDVLVNSWTTDLGRLQTEAGRWRTATGLLLQAADPEGSALELGQYAAATGKNALYNDQLQELAALKEEEIKDFAYKWLTRDRAAAVYFEPENTEIPRLVAGGGGAAPAAGSPGQGERQIGHEVTGNAGEYTPDKIRRTVLSPGLAATPHFKLSNGLGVFVLARPGAPVAQLSLRLRGGNATTKPVGAASIARGFSRSRCRDHGSLLPVGGRIGGGVGLATSETNASVLSGNLSNAIAVLADDVSCREADEEAFQQVLPRMIESSERAFQQEAKQPEFLAAKRLYGALYPDHPFSQVDYESPTKLKNLRSEDAQAFLSSHYRPDNGALAVYGDVELEEVKKESELYLSKWPTGGGASSMEPPTPPVGPTARQVFLVDRPKATQAIVSLGCRLADTRPEWLAALDVLDQVANERAWSLRAEWGATYGVHASVSRLPGNASDLTFNGLIENAQLGKSITRLLGIVGEIGNGKVEEKLFATKRWDAGLSFMNRFASAGNRARALLDAETRRWPLDVWDKYPERLAATTPASLKEIMVPCVGKEVVAIVGDASVLRPQLEKEGLRLEGK